MPRRHTPEHGTSAPAAAAITTSSIHAAVTVAASRVPNGRMAAAGCSSTAAKLLWQPRQIPCRRPACAAATLEQLPALLPAPIRRQAPQALCRNGSGAFRHRRTQPVSSRTAAASESSWTCLLSSAAAAVAHLRGPVGRGGLLTVAVRACAAEMLRRNSESRARRAPLALSWCTVRLDGAPARCAWTVRTAFAGERF